MPDWWDSYECPGLLYKRTPVLFPYYFNFALSNDDINFLFQVDFAEYSLFSLMSFVASASYGWYCTTSGDFRGIEDLC